jgi:hypothetical protein
MRGSKRYGASGRGSALSCRWECSFKRPFGEGIGKPRVWNDSGSCGLVLVALAIDYPTAFGLIRWMMCDVLLHFMI